MDSMDMNMDMNISSGLFNFTDDFKKFSQDDTSPTCNIKINDTPKYIKKADIPKAIMTSGTMIALYSLSVSSFFIFICVLCVLLSTIYSLYNNSKLSSIVIGIITVLFLSSAILANVQYNSSSKILADISSDNCTKDDSFDNPVF